MFPHSPQTLGLSDAVILLALDRMTLSCRRPSLVAGHRGCIACWHPSGACSQRTPQDCCKADLLPRPDVPFAKVAHNLYGSSNAADLPTRAIHIVVCVTCKWFVMPSENFLLAHHQRMSRDTAICLLNPLMNAAA